MLKVGIIGVGSMGTQHFLRLTQTFQGRRYYRIA